MKNQRLLRAGGQQQPAKSESEGLSKEIADTILPWNVAQQGRLILIHPEGQWGVN